MKGALPSPNRGATGARLLLFTVFGAAFLGADFLLAATKPIVFFDSNCLLCSRVVKILLKNDQQKLYYAGFETAIARKLLPENLHHEPQTIVLYSGGEVIIKSRAIFKFI